MEFYELVKKRASCRKYLPDKVERGKIERCIDAARLSPSACNSQPWNFVVVDSPEVLAKVSAAAVSGAYVITRFIKKAPVLIVVTVDKGSLLSKFGGFVRDTKFFLIDIGIACDHLVLQATELGLGTCFIGWFNEKGVKKELGIPDALDIPLIISMGYPDESRPSGEKRRKPLSDIMKYQ